MALTAACGPDFETADGADAGAGTGGSAGASTQHASGGTGGTEAKGGSGGTVGGSGSSTGGSSARGGTTGGTGDASGAGDDAGGASSGGSDGGDTGGSGGTNTAGGTDSTGGTSSTGGTDATGGTAGLGTGGTPPTAGMGGLPPVAGMGGVPPIAGMAGTSPIAGAPNGGGGGVIGGCNNQLLANADFESGPTSSWGEMSTWAGIEIIVPKTNSALVAEDVTPYAGTYLGWLGGIPDNMWDHNLVTLTQDVTLPADAATLTLSGYRWVKSVDDDSEEFDVAFLEFDDGDGDVIWQAQAWSNQTTTNGWVAFEATTTVEAAYRGKKLTFVAYSNTDPGGKTSFFLDDLELVASCGR